MNSRFKTIIGIDISKNTFDATKMTADNVNVTQHQEFMQTKKGFAEFVLWCNDGNSSEPEILICMEHTGLYINGLLEYLNEHQFFLWIEMPLRIKRSVGLQRGGDDKLSSLLIMQYAYRYQDAAQQWVIEDTFIQKLRHFTAQRQRLLTVLKILTVPVNELKQTNSEGIAKELATQQKGVISATEKSIAAIELKIEKLILANSEASKTVALVSSLKGVSTQTAINLYIYTKGFKTFTTAKQLASYCGVVPFERKSGISVRYKPKISPFSNKVLKRLLHLCAMSAIQHDKELKAYYIRKVGEGKNKMSSINAVRNKLVLRIFAVLRDGRPWVENYQRACA
jgi:transposase